MRNCKKLPLILVSIIFMIFVLYLIITSLYAKINSAKKLYKGATHSFSTLFADITSTFDRMCVAGSESRVINVCLEDVTKSPVSSISLTDNTKNKYIELNVNQLKTSRKVTVNLSTFVNSEKVGFALGSDPELYYVASGKRFRTKWNNSVYSKFFEIPDYVPDNLNYANISSVLSARNIFKAFLGMGIGKTKINIKEIIENISISEAQPYTLYKNNKKYKCEKISILMSKRFATDYIKKIRQSSEKAELNYMHNILVNAEHFLENISGENISMEVVIFENKLICIETAFITLNEVCNLYFDFNKDCVNLNITKFKKYKTDKLRCCLKLSNDDNPEVEFNYVNGQLEVVSLNVNKQSNNTICAEFVYCDENKNRNIASMTYKNVPVNIPDNMRTKDIYSLSVYDIFNLYNAIR